MKAVVTFLTILSMIACARAFDSASWLEKRDALRAEAKRLKAVYVQCENRVGEPAADVVVPIETFENGKVKTMVKAREAQYFHTEGLIWAKDVEVLKYGKDGEVKIRLTAETCVIDRMARSGWAEGGAVLTSGETVFKGNGVYFSSPEGYVSVLEGADVTSTDLKFGGSDQ